MQTNGKGLIHKKVVYVTSRDRIETFIRSCLIFLLNLKREWMKMQNGEEAINPAILKYEKEENDWL